MGCVISTSAFILMSILYQTDVINDGVQNDVICKDVIMSNEHELAMADFITETGLALQEMKLLIEDGVFLYTEEASSLLNLARANDQYGVAEAFSTIGSALYNLRALICNLQNDYVAEIKRQFSAESP